MVKCGRCHLKHESAAEVRECYNGGSVHGTKPSVTAKVALTDKQVNMAKILLRKLGLVWDSATPVDELERWGSGRKLIDALKQAEELQAHGKPWNVPAGAKVSSKPEATREERSPYPDVPEGHYAVPSATGNNDLDFWRVQRPAEGQWRGRTFVRRVIGGRPSVSVRGRTAKEALTAILEADPAKAAQRYGQEIGRCSRCNRHLTDETSRQYGKGPDCRMLAS
jgi:hypothetical protein